MAEAYYQSLSNRQGRPTKDARLVIGAVIIKHKLCLSDRETVAQIQENPYLQYFVGLPGYQMETPFAASLFVEIRKRMGASVFDGFYTAIVESFDQHKSSAAKASTTSNDHDDNRPGKGEGTLLTKAQEESEDTEEEVTHQGKLIVDATVAPQSIRYPNDLSLLNEAWEISERIIDVLYKQLSLDKKPRTYRQKARKDFLSVVKQRKPSKRVHVDKV